MAGGIKGIIVEIGGDTSKLQNALKKVNTTTSSLNKELKGINSLLKLDPKNTELVAQKQEVLKENIEQTSEKLKTMKGVQEQVYQKWQNYIKNEDKIKKIAVAIKDTKTELQKLKKEQEEAKIAFDKGEISKQQYNEICNKVKSCKTNLSDLIKEQKQFNETTVPTENYRKFQREIINTKSELKSLKVEASKWTTAGRSIEEFGNKVSNISTKVDNLGNKLTTRLTLPILGVATVLTKSAMEQEAAIQQIEKIYGNASQTIRDFAENSAISFNMSTNDAYKYAQIYGNLIQSITTDQAQNAQYTQELLKASAVIASATGRTMEDVMDRIRSGLLGNTEAIEDLGVNVNVALLESTDAFKKFAGDKSWNQLDFQTQQQIRLFGILEQTTKKYGNEINENTASKTQKLTARFENMANKIGKNLLPIANKLLDIVDEGIDKLDDLSDEEIENIVNITKFAVAIGPAIKLVGTFGKGIGTITKGVGTFSQAIAVAENNTNSEIASVNNLAKVISLINNPIGIFTSLTVAAGAAVYAYDQKMMASAKAVLEERKAIEQQVQARKELINQQNEQVNSNLIELESTQKLWKDLQNITDENGKIKQGYKDRASFIVEELSKALGIEIDINGDVIDKYKELQGEVDKTIQKKKAEIYLQGEEEQYKTALEGRKQGQAKLNELQQEYNEELEKSTYNGNDFWKSWEAQGARQKIQQLGQAMKEQNDLINTYNQDISKYEYDYELMMTNTADSLQELINRNEQNFEKDTSNLQRNTDAQIGMIQAKINYEKQKQDESISNLAGYLGMTTTTIESLTPEQIEKWKNLANLSYEEYSNALSNIPNETAQEIQKATGIILGDTELANASAQKGNDGSNEYKNNFNIQSTTREEINKASNILFQDTSIKEGTTDLARDANLGFDNNTDGYTSGSHYVENLGNGIKDKGNSNWFTGILNGVANTISSFFHHSTPDRGPLKDDDVWTVHMMENFANGIIKSKPKVVKPLNALAQKISEQMNISPIQDFGNLQGGLRTQIENKTNTIFTTPQIIFNVQELDDKKLQQCFDYINKKFGSKY